MPKKPIPAEKQFQGLAKVALGGSTHRNWAGRPNGRGDVAATSATQDLLAASWQVIDAIQTSGARYGCHECNRMVHQDATVRAWIGDHIPPKGLTWEKLETVAEAVEEWVEDDAFLDWYFAQNADRRVLMPSCDFCQLRQSGLVKRLKVAGDAGEMVDALRAFATQAQHDYNTDADGGRAIILRMLDGRPQGGQNPDHIGSSGDVVNATESGLINTMGTTLGCHICQDPCANRVYIADHTPPREFATSYMQRLCRELGVTIPPLVFRPHCRNCSSSQGGGMSRVMSVAADLCKERDIVIYKPIRRVKAATGLTGVRKPSKLRLARKGKGKARVGKARRRTK